MSVEYHPDVCQDVAEAAKRYRGVSTRLAQQFKAELRGLIRQAAANPGRFHVISPKFRRANLRRFPYHVIYREVPGGIRVTLVRHHRRNPEFGIERI